MKTVIATIQFEVEDEIDPTGHWVEQLLMDRINTGEGWWATLGDFVPHTEFEDIEED